MNILKSNIKKAIKKLIILYPNYETYIKQYGADEVINTWIEQFNAIEYDYLEANEDFLNAIINTTNKSKYPPTIHEIIEEMRNIFNCRQAEIDNNKTKEIWELSDYLKNKCILNIEKAKKDYEEILRKYGNIEIIKMIQEMQKDKYYSEQSIDFYLEEILKK